MLFNFFTISYNCPQLLVARFIIFSMMYVCRSFAPPWPFHSKKLDNNDAGYCGRIRSCPVHKYSTIFTSIHPLQVTITTGTTVLHTYTHARLTQQHHRHACQRHTVHFRHPVVLYGRCRIKRRKSTHTCAVIKTQYIPDPSQIENNRIPGCILNVHKTKIWSRNLTGITISAASAAAFPWIRSTAGVCASVYVCTLQRSVTVIKRCAWAFKERAASSTSAVELVINWSIYLFSLRTQIRPSG